MHTRARVHGIRFDGGDIILSFKVLDDAINSAEFCERNIGKDMILDVSEPKKAKSDQARKYFWQLVQKMAAKLGNDTMTQYNNQLLRYGVGESYRVITKAVEAFERDMAGIFRVVRETDSNEEFTTLWCVFGISDYSSRQLADLINGTVSDAKELGIETLTPLEIEVMLKAMEE